MKGFFHSSYRGQLLSGTDHPSQPQHGTVLHGGRRRVRGKPVLRRYIPGIMLGVFIMGMCYIISKKKHYPKGKKLPFKEALRVTKDTFFAMLAMVIIIGGVSAGFFTATESAAVACIYCLFVGFLFTGSFALRIFR